MTSIIVNGQLQCKKSAIEAIFYNVSFQNSVFQFFGACYCKQTAGWPDIQTQHFQVICMNDNIHSFPFEAAVSEKQDVQISRSS